MLPHRLFRVATAISSVIRAHFTDDIDGVDIE